jgi:hypothetical protein|tara:strand:- start:1553 stop:1771 length:219 start_codon:yes stop_codon:yes gene_type:complete
MDQTTYEEIVSALAKCGRPDLIQEFKAFVSIDEDFSPSEEVLENEQLSDDEGSASDEELNFSVDKDGFHCLA